ncbi:MAG TPA: D-alanyl-D-alanine carboxypeptidase/D-alanyl-D-alanine-endopeptidase [Methylomirabilota bacterium]|nr:D-alanyl-D-alanine carboxypeptidase/D-alanyl-D-alanine-endopeptidase [Methylomirabilota bacterium]
MRNAGIRIASVLLLSSACTILAHAQGTDTLEARIQKVMARPEFARSNFGIEFYDLETGKAVYSLNADKLFVPASTTKLLTEGTLLAKLGPDYRFHTHIYRTGSIDKHGTLKGNLILVASGDPNLSNRIQPDGTLAFVDEDHSYNGPALPGDPLAVIKEFVAQVAAKGIRKIEGNVYVDGSLMPDGEHEGGTGVTMSSIIVNDNILDLTATPGEKVGDPVAFGLSPQTSYFHFLNTLATGPTDSKLSFDATDPAARPDGSWDITISGNVPQGSGLHTFAYQIPSPTQFATAVLQEALQAKGIEIKPKKSGAVIKDFLSFQHFYTPENQVAEHVSPPLSEEIRITLKVSQNLHAGMGLYFLGLFAAKNTKDPLAAGFKIEHAFLTDAKLDLSGASQGDGAGGDWADLFSPDFMCHYLAYWKTRPDFQILFNGLPVLGKDGTLAKIQKDNPAAGHVFAKTGTFAAEDKLNSRLMLNGKGLAGFVQTKSGKTLAFAAYVNHVAMPADPESAQQIAGQALGEIAAAAYDASLP